MASPETDLRTHVALDDKLGAGEEGLLFQTAGFQFCDKVQLAVRVSNGTEATGGIHPFGGERRLAACGGPTTMTHGNVHPLSPANCRSANI
jgi:hypothetical protein